MTQPGVMLRFTAHDPVLDDVDDLLGSIDQSLKRLAEKQAAGEDVSEERKRLEKERAELEAERKRIGGESNGGGEEDELTRLRREKADRDLHDEASRVVDATLVKMAEKEAERKDRMREIVSDVLMERLGAENIDEAVRKAVGSTRGGSRFVGEGASPSLVEHVAKGGSYSLEDNTSSVRVGEDRGIKRLDDSEHKMGEFVRIVYRRKNSLPITDAEAAWFKKWSQKAMAEMTDTAGGYLVPQEWMPDILALLRAQTVVRRATPRIVPFDKQMNQTSISSGSTAYYTAENAQIPVSEMTFAEAPILTPKNLTALVPASNYLLNDAAQAETFIRQDIAEVLGLREDLAFLRGTGTGGEPKGFRNMVGITLDPVAPGASGARFTLAQLRRIIAVFRTQNAGAVRPTWFFNPEFLTYLDTLEEQSGGSPTGRLLVDAGILSYNADQTSGTLLGIPFYATTQLPNATTGGNPTTELYLVNMAEAIIGMNQEMEIDVSSEASYWDGSAWISSYQNNQSVFRAIMRHDITHRRPAQVIVQTAARTT